MIVRLLNRLFDIRRYAAAMLVSMLMFATFTGSVLAQTAASSGSGQAEQIVPDSAKSKNTFNHNTTGFPLTGAHITVTCETCHVNGNFAGTPRECASCHSTGRMIAATPKNQNHIQTTQACNVCHTSTATFQLDVMDHSGVTQPCSTCHNGGNPSIVSMSINHVQTTLPCDSCHKNTFSFLGAIFSHTGITNGCASCHNGQTAVGMAANHIPTTAPCELCHTPTNTSNYTTFLNATFDHTTVTGQACNTCHGGQYAGVKAQPSTHIPYPASADCSVCHNGTSTFVATWTLAAVHTAVTGTTCATCHDTGKSFYDVSMVTRPSGTPPHIQYNSGVDCATCHTSTITGGFVYVPPMNHTAVSTIACATCHTTGQTYYDVSIVTYPSNHATLSGSSATTSTSNCSSCHTTSSFLGATGGHGSMTPATAAGTCASSACHATGGAGLMYTSTAHIPATGISCDVCHTSSFSTLSFLTSTMIHSASSAISSARCDSCHGAASTYTSVVKFDTAHIPSSYYPAQDCGTNCHTVSSTSNYSVGGFSLLVMKGNATAHSGMTTCANCHNNTYAVGTASFPSHISIGSTDCSNCHTASNTGSYSSFLGASGGHTMTSTAAAGQCATSGCHVTGGAGLMYNNPPHIPATGISCDTCHTASFSSLSFLTETMNHSVVSASTCATCHSGSYTTQGTAGGAQTTTSISNHIPTAIIGAAVATTSTCSTCHSGTANWTTMTSTTAIHNGAQGGGSPIYCVTCHLSAGTYLEPAGFQAKNHNGASTSKDCSSSGCHKPLGSRGSSYTNWD